MTETPEIQKLSAALQRNARPASAPAASEAAAIAGAVAYIDGISAAAKDVAGVADVLAGLQVPGSRLQKIAEHVRAEHARMTGVPVVNEPTPDATIAPLAKAAATVVRKLELQAELRRIESTPHACAGLDLTQEQVVAIGATLTDSKRPLGPIAGAMRAQLGPEAYTQLTALLRSDLEREKRTDAIKAEIASLATDPTDPAADARARIMRAAERGAKLAEADAKAQAERERLEREAAEQSELERIRSEHFEASNGAVLADALKGQFSRG